MKKVVRLSEYGGNLRDEIIRLALLLSKNPKAAVNFNKNFAGCWYESDSPTYELVIDGFENDD